MKNKELFEKYTAETDIKKRAEYTKEMEKKAKDTVRGLCKGYDMDKIFESQTWTCEYANDQDIFILVNGDLGVGSLEDMKVLLNKKLLLDAIILRTTATDGHNGLLENLTEKNLRITNAILEKTTKTTTFTLSLVELQKLSAIPSLLTETEVKTLTEKGEEHEHSNNEVQSNTEQEEQNDSGRPENTDSMVSGNNTGNRTNDSRGGNSGEWYAKNYIRRPAGADSNWSESEVAE